MAEDQLALDGVGRDRSTAENEPARPGPDGSGPADVARVVVDSGLAHLDRFFDYAVPPELADDALVGVRVKVRFAGRLTDGFVVERTDSTGHHGRLAPLTRVVSSEPVLTPEVLRLARTVADRWAGTVSDVLRLAVPPRHARAEAAPSPSAPAELRTEFPTGPDEYWRSYPGSSGYLRALRDGDAPRAVWSAVPHRDPALGVAEAVLATVRAGRGAVVCVPDVRDIADWDATFTEVLGPGRHVVLTGGQKPAARYASFLAVARGAVSVVLGTRSAAYAPVADLGLVAVFDDGDDLFAEPRAPYPHTREVLLLRAVQSGAGVLLGGYARTAEAQALIETGWCGELAPEPATRRRLWPRVTVSDGTARGGAPARLPPEVFAAIRATTGPVLVQVPRRGYRTSLACQSCRSPARCRTCGGPLGQPAPAAPVACRWCDRRHDPWLCPECAGTGLRAPVVGQLRTVEEYRAAFTDRTVLASGGEQVLDIVEDDAIVLATPGAEPRVEGGYGLVVLMDTWLALSRDDLRVVEEAYRRWFNALALARETASAVVVGDATALQALVRADPVGVARRELQVRRETRLPPIGRVAVVDGPLDVLATLAERTAPTGTEVLGPVGAGDDARLVLRAPRRHGAALAGGLQVWQAERSAAKLSPTRVRIDPQSF